LIDGGRLLIDDNGLLLDSFIFLRIRGSNCVELVSESLDLVKKNGTRSRSFRVVFVFLAFSDRVVKKQVYLSAIFSAICGKKLGGDKP
jgi:hypothetical protein